MRTKSSLLVTSLLASLAACTDAPSNTPADAGPGADIVPSADQPTVDMPPAADTPPAEDVFVPSDAEPGTCGAIAPEVRAHVQAMSTTGWGALNRSRTMMMFGCAGATRARDCLSMLPEPSDADIGANRSAAMGARLRVLFTSTTASSYWTRSSPDGRFVARGVRVRDLLRGVDMTATGAQYDPAFFPDGSGFMYQPGGRLCPMSMLTTGMPTSVPVTGTMSQCTGSSVGLYEHLGASLNGSDYWANAAGTAAFDDGGRRATLTEARRNEAWTMTASTPLTLMANTGSGFMPIGTRSLRTPLQGDQVISPSSLLLVTRIGGAERDSPVEGYVLHRLTATQSGGAITASISEIGRYCVQGAKPAFSYDERYITYHHYIGGGDNVDADAREAGFTGEDDPDFAEYRTRGTSNIYVLDLVTGVSTRVTSMGPGQYALFPHFRSDGWLYFLVRTLGTSRESVIASDVVLPR